MNLQPILDALGVGGVGGMVAVVIVIWDRAAKFLAERQNASVAEGEALSEAEQRIRTDLMREMGTLRSELTAAQTQLHSLRVEVAELRADKLAVERERDFLRYENGRLQVRITEAEHENERLRQRPPAGD